MRCVRQVASKTTFMNCNGAGGLAQRTTEAKRLLLGRAIVRLRERMSALAQAQLSFDLPFDEGLPFESLL